MLPGTKGSFSLDPSASCLGAVKVLRWKCHCNQRRGDGSSMLVTVPSCNQMRLALRIRGNCSAKQCCQMAISTRKNAVRILFVFRLSNPQDSLALGLSVWLVRLLLPSLLHVIAMEHPFSISLKELSQVCCRCSQLATPHKQNSGNVLGMQTQSTYTIIHQSSRVCLLSWGSADLEDYSQTCWPKNWP